jgi:proline iminopeptidase
MTTNEIKGYTISNMIKDIEGVRRFLKIKKWFVLGHSWGGMLGLEYISHSPEHILGFVDMDGVVSWPAMQRSIVEQCQARFMKMLHSGAAQKAQATSLLRILEQVARQPLSSPTRMEGEFQLAMGPANLYFPAGQSDAFAALQTKIATAVAAYHVPATALYPAVLPALGLYHNDHLLTRDDTPLLGKITVPTLIIEGKEDGIITPAMAEIAHSKIEGSQLLELNNCGHFPFVSRPARTAIAVLQFVAEVEKHGFKEPQSAR